MGTRPYVIDPVVAHERAKKAARARTGGPYHLDKVREIVERTRAEQGLPPVVTDELTLGWVADIFRLTTPSDAA
jgi:hypothetical protein